MEHYSHYRPFQFHLPSHPHLISLHTLYYSIKEEATHISLEKCIPGDTVKMTIHSDRAFDVRVTVHREKFL